VIKRVLITGIGGFAGRHLAPVMAGSGFEVVGLSSSPKICEIDGVSSFHSADLRRLDELNHIVNKINPTHVVHLAAISFVGHDNISELYETNVVGTKNLLLSLSALSVPPQSILLASSANVYGNSTHGVLSEEHEFNPANDYAISKMAMEFVARQFFTKLNVCVARPFNYTGRGQSENFVVPKIVRHFKDRAPCIELGNLDVARDFSDVRMTVEYLSRMSQTPPPPGSVYNICSGVAYTLKQIIAICEEITGHNMEVRINPAFVRENELKYLVGSPDKLHRDYGVVSGYQIERTIEWMLSGA